VAAAVKELVENALDAGAGSIDVTLVNDGLDQLVVSDNGCGVPAEEVECLCRQHHTSKLVDFDDLQNIASCGFRGEGG